jgi:hypothetical protein
MLSFRGAGCKGEPGLGPMRGRYVNHWLVSSGHIDFDGVPVAHASTTKPFLHLFSRRDDGMIRIPLDSVILRDEFDTECYLLLDGLELRFE